MIFIIRIEQIDFELCIHRQIINEVTLVSYDLLTAPKRTQMKEKKQLTPDRYESFRVILSFSMCIDVTMQHEEKTVIRDWVQMWRVELYMYRQVYC